MSAIRYFRLDVNEGQTSQPAYFYETDTGNFDLQYGWGQYTGHMHDSLAAAIEDFRSHLQAKHDDASDEITVTVSEPVEVDWEEVRQHRHVVRGDSA